MCCSQKMEGSAFLNGWGSLLYILLRASLLTFCTAPSALHTVEERSWLFLNHYCMHRLAVTELLATAALLCSIWCRIERQLNPWPSFPHSCGFFQNLLTRAVLRTVLYYLCGTMIDNRDRFGRQLNRWPSFLHCCDFYQNLLYDTSVKDDRR